jgi:hypothetical protein
LITYITIICRNFEESKEGNNAITTVKNGEKSFEKNENDPNK